MADEKSPSSTDLPESLDGLTTAHFSHSSQPPSTSHNRDSLQTPPRPTPGSLFDGYEVLEILGEGGMGVVYKVKRQGEIYALKVLLTSSNDFSLRFQREAKIIGQLKHPNIVQLHKFQTEAAWPYIVFDFIEGSTLEALIQSRGPLPLREALDILAPIAKALDQIHSQGIFHRDIKPANILIRAADSASILTDFGLAKVTDLDSLTKTGEVLGTLFYMAPEQLIGKKCQAQTDIWALGLVLYSIVTGGQRPFRNPSPPAYAHNVLFSPPIVLSELSPELPPALDLVIGKALQKEPENRYASASEFIHDCHRALNNEVTIAKKTSFYQRCRQNWIRRFGKTSLYFLFIMVLFSAFFAIKEMSSFIQNSQRHHQFETDNLPQFLSIIERCKVQRQALDTDIVRHLSAQTRALPCCQSVSDLHHDLSELEAKTARFKAQQPHSEFIHKRLLTIQKLQESIRLLTLIHQVNKNPENKEFPSKQRQFFQVLSQMLQRDYTAARNLLESDPVPPKTLSSAFKFAKALCFYQCKQFNESTLYFTELKKQHYHESVVSPYLVDSLIQKSVEEFYEAPILKEKFSTTLNRALEHTRFNTKKAIKRWDQLVQDRFQSKKNKLSDKSREQIYLAYRSFTHSHPTLEGLTLTKSDWEQCLKSARNHKNQARIFFYCYQIQRMDPQFKIPAKFEFALDNNGQFKLIKMRDQLSVLYFLKQKTALEVFQYTYEASFHGLYLDLFDHGDIRRGMQKSRIIEKALTSEPASPLLQLWHAISISHSLLSLDPDLYFSKAIKTLEYPHNHPKLLKPYRALALTTKVKRINVWVKKKTAEMKNKARQKQCFKDLDQALAFHHPHPESVYWHRKDLHLWRRNSRDQIRGALPLILEDLKQYRRLIHMRYQLAKSQDLEKERPPGMPYTWISGSFFEEKLASEHQFRGLLYYSLGQFKIAEEELVKSCEVLNEKKAWKAAVAILKQTKNRALIQRLQIQIKNLRQRKLDPEDLAFLKVINEELSLIKPDKQ